MKQYTVVDLFAGAGGLSLGFAQTKRFEIVVAAENNPNARNTYKRNHKNTCLYSDVRTIDYSEIKKSFGNIDVVIGGPPCQGFSNANRQHSTIISMNNRLVKEYVRAICQLKPTAFVMENVAMLRSNVHRFIVDEDDLKNDIVMGLDLSEDNIELAPAIVEIPDITGFAKNSDNIEQFSWDEKLFKIITVLYRYRINQSKFDKTVAKHKTILINFMEKITETVINEETPAVIKIDCNMAQLLMAYVDDGHTYFDDVISAIEPALFIQRMLHKMNELRENNIHIFKYVKSDTGALSITVKSYAVFDYIKGILESEYALTPMTLNAADYGAPQKRERFVIVGVSKSISKKYKPPKAKITDGKYFTVRDAIEDLESVPAYYDIDTPVIHISSPPENISKLAKKLRRKRLYT